MTTEEKFKKLLYIAVENGYQVDSNICQWLEINDETAYGCEKLNIPKIVQKQGVFMEFSLRIGHWFQPINDLVLQTNFFECLFKDFTVVPHTGSDRICFELIKDKTSIFDNVKSSKNQLLKFQWILEVEKGTALEWLFKQFNL